MNKKSILDIDVKGKKCLMVDDMIDTAGTIVQGAKALHEHGAKEVYACCTHGVLSGPAMERLTKSPIKEIAVLDTINLPDDVKANPKIKVLSVAKHIAKDMGSERIGAPPLLRFL